MSDHEQADVYHITIGGVCVDHTLEFADVARFIVAAGGTSTFKREPDLGWIATGSDGRLIVVTKDLDRRARRVDEWLG